MPKYAMIKWTSLLGLFILLLFLIYLVFGDRINAPHSSQLGAQPLVMKGGDPYLRALMRTISSSEANDPSPYTLLYRGNHTNNLKEHPRQCIKILTGVNAGKCSTASGRYQILDFTWDEKADQYHTHVKQFFGWKQYPFYPEDQDIVVYRWLCDSKAWNQQNISQLLRENKLQFVLKLLSPTWTSLGYGIEDNVMSDKLPKIYQKLLAEELKNAKNRSANELKCY